MYRLYRYCVQGSRLGISFSLLSKDHGRLWHLLVCATCVSPNISKPQCKSQSGPGTSHAGCFPVTLIFGRLGECRNTNAGHTMPCCCNAISMLLCQNSCRIPKYQPVCLPHLYVLSHLGLNFASIYVCEHFVILFPLYFSVQKGTIKKKPQPTKQTRGKCRKGPVFKHVSLKEEHTTGRSFLIISSSPLLSLA